MSVIDSFANRIAVSIKKTNPEKTHSVEVMTFALIILINGLVSFSLAMLIGIITGYFLATLLAIVAFVLLRMCSGGYHFQSSVSCTIVSIAIFVLIPHIPMNYMWFLVLTGCSLMLILLYAPAQIEQHSNIPKKYYPLLKCIAFVLVCMNLVFQSPVLTLAFFGQALSLIYVKRKEGDT